MENNNNKMEQINDYKSLDEKKYKKIKINQSKNNKIFECNSFFEDKFLTINSFRINNNKKKNKIKFVNKGLYNNINNNKICKSKDINCFKKLNLTNIIFNNNPNQNNSMLNFCQTTRTIKSREKNKDILIDNKNIPLSTKNNKIINENCISHHSLPNYKKPGLNKIPFKRKEINKFYIPDIQNYSQKTERPKKEININDIHKLNIKNYLSKSDRFLNNKNNDEYQLKAEKDYSININEYDYNTYLDKSYKTLYNPTFTSFLNRTININNGKIMKKSICFE